MENRATTIELLNELIQVNEDRSEGYTHVSESLEKAHSNIDLQCVFSNFAMNSMRYTSMLKDKLFQLGAKSSAPATSDDAFTNDLQHVKDSFKGSDQESILTSCEAGERATLSIFKKILDKDLLSRELTDLIRSQQEMLLKAYQYINEYRNEVLNHKPEYNNTLAY